MGARSLRWQIVQRIGDTGIGEHVQADDQFLVRHAMPARESGGDWFVYFRAGSKRIGPEVLLLLFSPGFLGHTAHPEIR